MGFIIFLIVGAVIFYNVVQKGKEKQAQWRKAAERLGLGYYPGGMGSPGVIKGLKGGHLVEVDTFSRTHHNNTSVYTRYKIRYDSPIRPDFRIVRQHAVHTTPAFRGLQDIETGDPAFDDRALVQGMYPERVVDFLTPPRQRAIIRLLESYVDVEISNECIELTKSGKDFNPHAVYNTTRMLLSTANDLTDDSPSLAETEGHVIEIEEPSAAPILNVGKKPKEADFVDAWEGPPIEIPVEPAVDEPVENVPEPAAEEPEMIETPAAPPTEKSETVSLTLQSIAEHLYGGGAGTMLQSGSVFQEHYENQTVSGEGILKRVGKFSYDPVFTNTEGIKASFDVCTLAGPYSKIKVVADVMYPAGRYDDLKAKVGTALPIAGKLIAQNSTLTQFYLIG